MMKFLDIPTQALTLLRTRWQFVFAESIVTGDEWNSVNGTLKMFGEILWNHKGFLILQLPGFITAIIIVFLSWLVFRRRSPRSVKPDETVIEFLSDDPNDIEKPLKHTHAYSQASGLSDEPLWWISKEETKRSLSDCFALIQKEDGPSQLTEEEILSLIAGKYIAVHQLEKYFRDDPLRAVHIRRKWLIQKYSSAGNSLNGLPYRFCDYSRVTNTCCEQVIGYVPVPVGIAGPLLMDKQEYYVPLATTEGCLVASTNRGFRAIAEGTGVRSFIYNDSMSRGPVVRLPSAEQVVEVKDWIEKKGYFPQLKNAFDSTSKYLDLKRIRCFPAGRLLYLRFEAQSGDAMGMNMVSKGTEEAMRLVKRYFPCMEVLSLSGNMCVDKKPNALNWIEGRGKSVICEAKIPKSSVETVLKSNVDALVELNTAKNLVGSAMAGSIGGFNAHSANLVTAIFIATGQDVAQVVGSCACLTQMENMDGDLYISCTMPCLEVGSVGGGTILEPQRACLNLIKSGDSAKQLARVICGTVLAGELSLMAALSSGDLVKSHMQHNRSQLNLQMPANSSAKCLPKLGDACDRTSSSASRSVLDGVLKDSSQCSQVIT